MFRTTKIIFVICIIALLIGCSTPVAEQDIEENKSEQIIETQQDVEDISENQSQEALMCEQAKAMLTYYYGERDFIEGTPEEILAKLSDALIQDDVDKAMDYIIYSEEELAHFQELFEALGPEGRKSYGQMLAGLERNTTQECKVGFTGQHKVANETLNVKASMANTHAGWKLTEVR